MGGTVLSPPTNPIVWLLMDHHPTWVQLCGPLSSQMEDSAEGLRIASLLPASSIHNSELGLSPPRGCPWRKKYSRYSEEGLLPIFPGAQETGAHANIT